MNETSSSSEHDPERRRELAEADESRLRGGGSQYHRKFTLPPDGRLEAEMKGWTLVALVAIAGCTVGPDYLRPVVDTPPEWRIEYPKATEVADTKWWEQFGDPVLNELIETALRENRDVRIAAARVDQFI